MAKHYRLILFDCVNTLYLPDPSRLPRLELDGASVPSTALLMLETLRTLDAALQPETVHHAARNAWRWAEAQRGSELREVPATLRMRRLFEELGLGDAPADTVEQLLEVHMRAVTGSFDFPARHRELLSRLRGRYALALFSNFDHGPSLLRLLGETGIAGWFDPLLISDGLGYRKPGRAAFARALERISAPPAEILFVGDSLEDDVRGARDAGIDVAWINAKDETAPADCRPTYELRALAELAALLEA